MEKREGRSTGGQSDARGRGNSTGDYPPSPLVSKHDFLLAIVARDQGLRRAPLAVLAAVLAHYNESERAAWPSFALIAAECGINLRTTKRAVAALAKRGYVEIQSGTRTTSNRYRIPFEIVQKLPGRAIPVVANGPPQVVATTPPQVVAQQVGGSGEPVPDVVAHRPPELSYQPGYEPGVDREMDDKPGTPPEGRLEAPSGSPPVVVTSGAEYRDQYPAFWSAYPKRIQVHATEAKLREMERGGAPMPDILAGARRYAAYVVINPKMMMNPVRWLEEQRWRDSWTITTSKSTPGRAKATTTRSKAATRPAAGTRTRTTARPAKAVTTGHAESGIPGCPEWDPAWMNMPGGIERFNAMIEWERTSDHPKAVRRRELDHEQKHGFDLPRLFPRQPRAKTAEEAAALAKACVEALTPPPCNKTTTLHQQQAIRNLTRRLIGATSHVAGSGDYQIPLAEFMRWHQAQEQTMPGGDHAG